MFHLCHMSYARASKLSIKTTNRHHHNCNFGPLQRPPTMRGHRLVPGAVVLVFLYILFRRSVLDVPLSLSECPPLDHTFGHFAALPYDLGNVVVVGDCDAPWEVLQRHHTNSVRYVSIEELSVSEHADTLFVMSINDKNEQRVWRTLKKIKHHVKYMVAYSALKGRDDGVAEYFDFSNILFLNEPSSRLCDDGSFVRDVAVIAKGGIVHEEQIVIEGVKSRKSAEKRYFLTWTTDAATWMASPLRWLVIEQLFKIVPDAEVFMFSNHLPIDFFSKFPNVHLIRYSESRLFHHTPLQGWAENIEQWKKGKFYYSHFSDVFRICMLWRYGGNYIDTDVLLLNDLENFRSTFGAEDILRSPEQTFWEWIRNTQPTLDKLYNVNLAIASFEQYSPFLSYVMHQLHYTYDPDVWNSAGPGLVQRCIAEWQLFHNDLVILRSSPSSSTTVTAMAGSVTLFTNPGVFYPVSWRDAITATRREDFNPKILKLIHQLPSYAYHVYTQMFKATNITFSIEPGSLLDRLLTTTTPQPKSHL